MPIEFSQLLQLMVHKDASDLFITAAMPPCMKINGRITPVVKTPLSVSETRDLVQSIMSGKQRDEFDRSNECNFAISAEGIGRFRVSAYVQRDTPGMVLRRIKTQIPTLDDLKLPQTIKELAMTKRGMVLFVGGTGSGKSTSLAAMIGYRNHNSTGHVISIEDPIEFIHQHAGCIITQREVGLDTQSYEVALKNTLRQAPDVILIGEVRTREMMDYAVAFAETGHLCLSTLHANNANQALDRIINFFPEERRGQLLMDLSLNLRAVVAQQLVKTVDGKGRRCAVEVLINTPLVADVIRKGEVHKIKEIMKRATEQGMQTFDQALYNLYSEGAIDMKEALAHADSANEVRLMIKLGKRGTVDQYAESMNDVNLEETGDKNRF